MMPLLPWLVSPASFPALKLSVPAPVEVSPPVKAAEAPTTSTVLPIRGSTPVPAPTVFPTKRVPSTGFTASSPTRRVFDGTAAAVSLFFVIIFVGI